MEIMHVIVTEVGAWQQTKHEKVDIVVQADKGGKITIHTKNN